MQLNLSNKLNGLLYLFLVGCASSAPELPEDYRSVDSTNNISESLFSRDDLGKNCLQLSEEILVIDKHRQTLDSQISQDRAGEQAVALVAAVAVPVTLLFLQEKSGVAEQLNSLQERKDTIQMLQDYKKCMI